MAVDVTLSDALQPLRRKVAHVVVLVVDERREARAHALDDRRRVEHRRELPEGLRRVEAHIGHRVGRHLDDHGEQCAGEQLGADL